eukprot:TRINITY_DN9437_c0_g1_i1.p2 TRINITY_DN9437_c0_g1~~TRINITY_DN9437_c0_g1_i1.p2  ORF type:complete len:221 (+),score=58.00 TRINITY_DN9437_c0_g1_i1:49-711(+)
MGFALPSWRAMRAFEAARGKNPRQYSAWGWVLPKSYVPRLLVGFSGKRMASLLYQSSVVNWKPVGKERLELALSGEKLFEGNATLAKPEHSQKFPDVNVTTGAYAPRSELVILMRASPHPPAYRDAVEAWASAWPGKTTRLCVAESHHTWPNAWQDAGARADTHHCVTFDARPLYDHIAYTNASVPYVFLVDGQGLIRWRSCWAPTQREVEFLQTGWTLD